MKDYSEAFAAGQRAIVQAEINAHKVNIDRSVFKKTDFERERLKTEKFKWKHRQKW